MPDPAARITVRGRAERPNDITYAAFDAAGRPIPLFLPVVRAPAPQRPRAAGAARPLSTCTGVAFDASASAGAGRLIYRWHFGDGGHERSAGGRL